MRRGSQSFEYLRTVDGTLCVTYREASHRRGMLEVDTHWDATLQETSVLHVPSRLRIISVIMLDHYSLSSLTLWESHRDILADNILYRHHLQNFHIQVDFNDEIFN